MCSRKNIYFTTRGTCPKKYLQSFPWNECAKKSSTALQETNSNESEDNAALAYLADDDDEGYYRSFHEGQRSEDEEAEIQANSSDHQSQWHPPEDEMPVTAESCNAVFEGWILLSQILEDQNRQNLRDTTDPIQKELQEAALTTVKGFFKIGISLCGSFARTGDCRSAVFSLINTLIPSQVYGTDCEASSEVSDIDHILKDK